MKKQLLLLTLLVAGANLNAVVGQGGLVGGSDAYQYKTPRLTTTSRMKIGQNSAVPASVVLNAIRTHFKSLGDFKVVCEGNVRGQLVAEFNNPHYRTDSRKLGGQNSSCSIIYTGSDIKAAYKTLEEFFTSEKIRAYGISINWESEEGQSLNSIGWFYTKSPMGQEEKRFVILGKTTTAPKALTKPAQGLINPTNR